MRQQILYVPCAWCDEKVGQRGLAKHVLKQHGDDFDDQMFVVPNPVVLIPGNLVKKHQAVITVRDETGEDCQDFLANFCSLDEASTLFWVAHIGPRNSAARYKYTLRVTSKDNNMFEGTRNCVPCDLSHKCSRNIARPAQHTLHRAVLS